MNKDVSKKLGDILKGVDTRKISESKKTVENLLRTPEGQKLQKQLDGLDKDKLVESFMKMDTSEIKKKLNKADLSSLSGLSADDIMKKLR